MPATPGPMSKRGSPPGGSAPRGSTMEVLLAFLRLGCLSFGGPIAHLGYFRTEFVERRGWVSDESFAEIVALTQSLPGPASSQTGYALGFIRAGRSEEHTSELQSRGHLV